MTFAAWKNIEEPAPWMSSRPSPAGAPWEQLLSNYFLLSWKRTESTILRNRRRPPTIFVQHNRHVERISFFLFVVLFSFENFWALTLQLLPISAPIFSPILQFACFCASGKQQCSAHKDLVFTYCRQKTSWATKHQQRSSRPLAIN